MDGMEKQAGKGKCVITGYGAQIKSGNAHTYLEGRR
jgi:hypothetical protein